jgi:hypothetical protein
VIGTPVDIAILAAQYERRPQSIKDEANRRLGILDSCEDERRKGIGKRETLRAVAEKTGVSWQTINGWYRLVAGIERHGWLYALAPRYTGRSATAAIEVEAWDLFKADYLRSERPSLSACYERLERIAAERGWHLASVDTFKRRLVREVPAAVCRLKRFGASAAKSMYPAQCRDRTMFLPMQAVCADAHQFDNLVKWPDGSIDRPYALVWQDLRTNKVLSWRIGRAPSAEMVRLSFGDVVETYGVPSQAYLDNGREFASKWMSGGVRHRYRFKVKPDEPLGVFIQLGTEVIWVNVASGQSKPIERAFGTVAAERIAKAPDLAGSYTGRNPLDKPYDYGRKPATLDVFVKVVKRELSAFNDRASSARVLGGLSPDQAWAELFPHAIVRKATAAQRALWLLAAEGVTARKPSGELHLCGNRYWGEFLRDHVGAQLVIRFDPQNLHRPIFVYSPEGRLLGEASCIENSGFRDQNAAQEHSRLRNQILRADKERAKAEVRMTALDVARALPSPPSDNSPTVAAKIMQPIYPAVRPIAAGRSVLDQADEEHQRWLTRQKKRDLSKITEA